MRNPLAIRSRVERGTTARIFISYRREDSREYAVRVHDRLVYEFGRDQVFIDQDAIEPGAVFPETLERALNSADALIAVIGPAWAGIRRSDGVRRLDDEHDFVRRELAHAFHRKIRVIPLLVGGARMPDKRELPQDIAPLADHQAVQLAANSFHTELDGLVETLRRQSATTLLLFTFLGAFASTLFSAVMRALVTEPSIQAAAIVAGLRWGFISCGVLLGLRGYISLRTSAISSMAAMAGLLGMLSLVVTRLLDSLASGQGSTMDTIMAGVGSALTYGLLALGLLLGYRSAGRLDARSVWLWTSGVCAGAFIGGALSFLVPNSPVQIMVVPDHERFARSALSWGTMAFVALLWSRSLTRLPVRSILVLSGFVILGAVLGEVLTTLSLLTDNSPATGIRLSFGRSLFWAALVPTVFIGVERLRRQPARAQVSRRAGDTARPWNGA